MQHVLLDTSFLICLSTPSRTNHQTAKTYYQNFIARGVTMFLSTIVISEFEVRQRVTDLDLHNFIVKPFNYDDACTAGRLFERGFAAKAPGDDRVAVKDDIKLLAQCMTGGIEHFITDDGPCTRRVAALRSTGTVASLPHAICIQDPFSDAWFAEGNQASLSLG
ncbi:hypothetical protein SAMN05216345_101878 [Cupriavidus sp. YR651]|uniref:hypothetical protein n=1 Tax=Cupriavidus sp. YR651 TaxID=1855315 RepID=UPI00088D91D5|nr:hypothetical protein [Cupriavidus sp. YR651]SDC19461.1 hypothetical protein SAMN05216345_101878 [Cupriavidus sp. YR651]